MEQANARGEAAPSLEEANQIAEELRRLGPEGLLFQRPPEEPFPAWKARVSPTFKRHEQLKAALRAALERFHAVEYQGQTYRLIVKLDGPFFERCGISMTTADVIEAMVDAGDGTKIPKGFRFIDPTFKTLG